MIVSAGPNWLGSPQHFVVGAIAAMVVFAAARSKWIRLPEWVAFVLAVSLVSAAELVLELIEYPLLYADHFHHSAYYDTLADMANSVVGAVVGGIVAAIFTRRRVRDSLVICSGVIPEHWPSRPPCVSAIAREGGHRALERSRP